MAVFSTNVITRRAATHFTWGRNLLQRDPAATRNREEEINSIINNAHTYINIIEHR